MMHQRIYFRIRRSGVRSWTVDAITPGGMCLVWIGTSSSMAGAVALTEAARSRNYIPRDRRWTDDLGR